MFWRFGLHHASSIDTLLERDDFSLEELLDEEDLLQECKNADARLSNYLSQPDTLTELFSIITSNLDNPESTNRHASTASEVLCSDIPAIVETCLVKSEQLLRPFWTQFLDVPPERLKLLHTPVVQFAKINITFINKRPSEMFTFLQTLPAPVDKLLANLQTAHFPELLVRISHLHLHDNPAMERVLPWLSSQGLIPKLVEKLSPYHPPPIHVVAADLIKSIIVLNAPNSSQVTDGFQSPSSNQFATELAAETNVRKLLAFILDQDNKDTGSTSTANGLPDQQSRTSSRVTSTNILLELIRKNNSDDSESYLFHTLRNRLIQVQQSFDGLSSENPRATLERAMTDMTEKNGVVQLRNLLSIASERLEDLKNILTRMPIPKSTLANPSTNGCQGLTFERLRICELLVELLNCSNMSLLNRRRGSGGPEYDDEGHLQGGLAALEQLAHAVSSGKNGEGEDWQGESGENEMEPAKEMPVSGSSRPLMPHSSPSFNSEDSFSEGDDAVSSDGSVDDISIDVDNSVGSLGPLNGSEELSRSTSSKRSRSARISNGSTSREISRSRSDVRMRSASEPGSRSCADRYKFHMVHAQLLPVMLDLFFGFPWNNILHSVISNLVHQVLLAGTDSPESQELVIALFRDARLLHRILEAHGAYSSDGTKPVVARAGYMGHLVIISDYVIAALEKLPLELKATVRSHSPQQEWDNFVHGKFQDIKKREATLLGGTRPMRSMAMPNGIGDIRWSKMDEDDSSKVPIVAPPTLKGTFRRAESLSSFSRSTVTAFAPAPATQSEPSTSHFEQYLAEEISSNRQYGIPSDDNSDEDEEDAGWLAQSHFDLTSNLAGAGSTPLASAFDDDFSPPNSKDLEHSPMADEPDNAEFGPFTDSSAVDLDFGDFQNADEMENQGMDGSWYIEEDNAKAFLS